MNVVRKIMHFLIHNGIIFTVGVMCLVHVTLLVIFSVAGVHPLVRFNVASVIIYVIGLISCKFGRVMPVYISIIVEVTVYTIFSTYYIGLKCGTYCFLFSIVPIIIYFGCFLFKGARRWSIVLMLAINFAVFVVLYVIFTKREPMN